MAKKKPNEKRNQKKKKNRLETIKVIYLRAQCQCVYFDFIYYTRLFSTSIVLYRSTWSPFTKWKHLLEVGSGQQAARQLGNCQAAACIIYGYARSYWNYSAHALQCSAESNKAATPHSNTIAPLQLHLWLFCVCVCLLLFFPFSASSFKHVDLEIYTFIQFNSSWAVPY